MRLGANISSCIIPGFAAIWAVFKLLRFVAGVGDFYWAYTSLDTCIQSGA